MSAYTPPAGPPPSRQPHNTSQPPAMPERRNSNDLDIPDEPPPAYTSVAVQGDSTVDAGPSRMDFSGPPPMPDRLQTNITGVGIGYGARIPGQGISSQQTGSGSYLSPQGTGGSALGSNNPFGDHNRPPPPPSHPSRTESGFSAPSGPPPGKPNVGETTYRPPADPPAGGGSSQAAGPSRPPPPVDLSPTEVPTPGRPLLRHGQMLVYPKGFFCQKCESGRISSCLG